MAMQATNKFKLLLLSSAMVAGFVVSPAHSVETLPTLDAAERFRAVQITGETSPIDLAYLFPNSPDIPLPSLEDMSWLKTLLPQVNDQLYGEGKSSIAAKKMVRFDSPQLEIESKKCLRSAKSWKLVAVRLEPFGSVAFGDGPFLDARAKEDPRFEHRRTPQVRLTFQPLCDPKTNSFSDSALHVVFNAFDSKEFAFAQLQLWRRLREAIAQRWTAVGADQESKIRGAEAEWLSHLNSESGISAQSQLISEIETLRDIRVDSAVDDADFRRHAESIRSLEGLYARSSDGSPIGLVSHPLLNSARSETWIHLTSLINRLDSPEFLFQIRMTSAGSGRLSWIFSNSEYDFKSKRLLQIPVEIYETRMYLPNQILEIGAYDFRNLDQTQAFKAAPFAIQSKLASTHATRDLFSSRDELQATVRRDSKAMDPAATHASVQSCFNCHSLQERLNVAKKTAAGAGSREFGYFFRAFGYIGTAPFISERFLNEVEATAKRLSR